MRPVSKIELERQMIDAIREMLEMKPLYFPDERNVECVRFWRQHTATMGNGTRQTSRKVASE